jgi:hypothetical protein
MGIFAFPTPTRRLYNCVLKGSLQPMGISAKIDIGLKIFDAVKNLLTVANVPKETAETYAYFAVEMYKYIESRPQLQFAITGAKATFDMAKGAQGYIDAMGYAERARELDLVSSAERFAGRGTVSAGAAISAFVDYFAGMAKSLGIEVNECAIAVTKVMLDVLTTLALAETVVGVWAAALQLLSTKADVLDMKRACCRALE